MADRVSEAEASWHRVRGIMLAAGIANPEQYLVPIEEVRQRAMAPAAPTDVERDLHYLQQQAAAFDQRQAQANFFNFAEVLNAGVANAAQQQTRQHGLLPYHQQAIGYAQTGLGLGIDLGGPGNSEADRRAHALLLRLLTPEQRAEYEGRHGFSVDIGNRRYQLSWNSLQVQVIENGELIENWCANLPNAPREDTLIAQLLLLRSDPDRLRKMAVVTKYGERGNPVDFEPPVVSRRRLRRIDWSPAVDLLRRAGYLDE